MELRKVVRLRRMVRRYTGEPVDKAVVRRALEHAVRAPSAGFTQGWAFLVLDEPEDIARFWAATTPAPADDPGAPERSGWLAGMSAAPVVVVPLSSKQAYLDRYAEPDKGWADRAEARWPAPYWDIDTGMAALLILLTAVDEGIGGCFFGIPPERTAAFKAEFAIPADHDPIGAITLGHPAADQPRGSAGTRPRRGLGDVVHRGRW